MAVANRQDKRATRLSSWKRVAEIILLLSLIGLVFADSLAMFRISAGFLVVGIGLFASGILILGFLSRNGEDRKKVIAESLFQVGLVLIAAGIFWKLNTALLILSGAAFWLIASILFLAKRQ
jgi:hypothetical protein